jgi:hypothetical protein
MLALCMGAAPAAGQSIDSAYTSYDTKPNFPLSKSIKPWT